MYNCIIILGATATGKTSLSVELAKQLNSEIINADSTQVYKGLNIGTAKVTEKQARGVVHHLISFLPPDASFSVQEFRQRAHLLMQQMWQENKLPIIVGGTGFYLESIYNNYAFGSAKANEDLRKQLNNELMLHGKEKMHIKLTEIDPASAAEIHENDTKRVLRALEIFYTTGKTRTQINNEHSTMQENANNGTMQNAIKPLFIGLCADREILYEKINNRVDEMFKEGLVKEVEGLVASGLTRKHQSMNSIGYKELIGHFQGESSLEEAKELIKKNTRNYAKRQVTWFKRIKQVTWFNAYQQDVSDIVKQVLTLLNS